jgi:hypothetical protein
MTTHDPTVAFDSAASSSLVALTVEQRPRFQSRVSAQQAIQDNPKLGAVRCYRPADLGRRPEPRHRWNLAVSATAASAGDDGGTQIETMEVLRCKI